MLASHVEKKSEGDRDLLFALKSSLKGRKKLGESFTWLESTLRVRVVRSMSGLDESPLVDHINPRSAPQDRRGSGRSVPDSNSSANHDQPGRRYRDPPAAETKGYKTGALCPCDGERVV